MHNDFTKNEIDYIQRYEAVGFTDQYRIVNGQLENVDTKHTYSPNDVTILREHRFEGMSNPEDMSLLYVIQTIDGSKGTLLASYGANADTSIHEFMNSIPDINIKNDILLAYNMNRK